MTDITRRVLGLESAGLVERRRIAEDRWVVLVKATRNDPWLLAALDKPVSELHLQLLWCLTRAAPAKLVQVVGEGAETVSVPM